MAFFRIRLFRMGESTRALILSFIGGVLNIFCKDNFNFYATMQTNNTVTLASKIVEGRFSESLPLFLVILSFLIGLLFACVYEYRRKDRSKKEMFLVCGLLLLLDVFIPLGGADGILTSGDLVSAVLISLASAIMLHSFVKSDSRSFTPSMMTANMNRLVSTVFGRLLVKDKRLNYAVFFYICVFVFFIAGVCIGHLYYLYISRPAYAALYNLTAENEPLGYNVFLVLKQKGILAIPALLFFFLFFSVKEGGR